jgi:ornithine cyclodeaminase/alanine dehydrogenase-like protein (mu-crystallin family)
MPASSNDGLGVKIVTLAVPAHEKAGQASVASSIGSMALSSASETGSSTTAVDVPSGSVVGSAGSSTTPKGSITLLDKYGAPRALINAEEITAFRTALASTLLFKKRSNVHDVTVFGAGKQAYWHTRLALILRGPEIHHLNIINRSFDTAHKLIKSLYYEDDTQPSTETTEPLFHPKISIITPGHKEYDRLLKAAVRGSSVIFCTTPSLTPLFPASYLTNPEGRKKGRYIAAIGSYKPHMCEVHPDIIRQNVAPQHGHHHHKHAREGGAVIVDSVDACLKEAGEIIQAGIGGKQLVEVGELVMLKREAERRQLEAAGENSHLDSAGVELQGGKKAKNGHDHEDDGGLMEWLQKGSVIYKSVGLGLMDVVVGTDLVKWADERGIGTRIQDF